MKLPQGAMGLARDGGWRRSAWWKLAARYPLVAVRVLTHRAHWRIEWELEAIARMVARFTRGRLWEGVPGVALRAGKLVRREAAVWKRIGIFADRDEFLFSRRAVRLSWAPGWWPWRDEWGAVLPTPFIASLVRFARIYWSYRYALEHLAYRMGFLEVTEAGHYLDGDYRLRWWRTWEGRLNKAAEGMVDGAALWVRGHFSEADVELCRMEGKLHDMMASELEGSLEGLATAAKSRDRAKRHEDLAARIERLLHRSAPATANVKAALEAVEKRIRREEKRARDT